MKNALLIPHIMDAITTAALFLFQMATLMDSINIYFVERGRVPERQKTHMRSTSKKEAAATAKYAGI